MKKEKFVKYQNYVWLSYFRWLFLIKSSQYNRFYKNNQVALLIERQKQLKKEQKKIIDRFCELCGWKMDMYPSLEDLIESYSHDDNAKGTYEKLLDLKDKLDIVEKKLRKLRKTCIQVAIEAKKKFKLKVRGEPGRNDIEQLNLVKGIIKDHLEPKFYGHKPTKLFDMEEKEYKKAKSFFGDDAVHQLTSLQELNKLFKSEKISKSIPKKHDEKFNTSGSTIFKIDLRYPYPFIVDVFKEKLKKVREDNIVKVQPEGRARFKEWEECLIAYELSKKDPLEIGRIMGAKINVIEINDNEIDVNGQKITNEKDRVSFTLKPISKKDWDERFKSKILWKKTKSDITYEEKLIKDNIRKKIKAAQGFINKAGKGHFPGFDNKLAELQAQQDIKTDIRFFKDLTP